MFEVGQIARCEDLLEFDKALRKSAKLQLLWLLSWSILVQLWPGGHVMWKGAGSI